METPLTGAVNNPSDFKYQWNDFEMFPAYIAIGILAITLFYLAKNKSILKDITLSKEHPPYSLARTQLAWWTLIVSGCYIYIWGLCGYDVSHQNILTSSALVLMGISLSTTATARVIDTSEEPSTRYQNDNKGNSFITNLLSDNNGISIHRFQNLVFTIVLGINFIVSVIQTGMMPVYDNQTLTLMGISAVAYASLKTTENKVTPTPLPVQNTITKPVVNTPPAPPEKEDNSNETH